MENDIPIGIDGCVSCKRGPGEEHADGCKALKMEGVEITMWDMIEENQELKYEIFRLKNRIKELESRSHT